METYAERLIDGKKRQFFDWRELWQYRELFYFFTWRDIKIKYKQTFLGFVWAILQPFLMMVVFTFFFGRVLKVPAQDMPYPVFVFSGLLIWNVFSGGLTNAANSMVNNSTIIKKIYFPRLIIPFSSVLVALFDWIMSFVLFVILLIVYKQSVSSSAFWMWPLAVGASAIAVAGPGSWLAALNVKYRDFRYVIPFLIQILFFLTPIIYPVTMLEHPVLKYIVAASPIYCAVELFRWPMTLVHPNPSLIYVSAISGFLLFFIGILYFKRTEDFFADIA